MLNRSQISILKFLSACNDGSASYTALFDKFGASLNFNLSRLIMSGDVSCNKHPQFISGEIFFITSKGYQALDDAQLRSENARKQAAGKKRENEENRAYAAEENRKNRKHDYLVALFEAFIAYIVGVVTQAEFDIAGFVVKFVEKAISLFH